MLGAGLAYAQPAAGPPPGPAPTGLVVGSGKYYSPIVANLDEAVAFYRDGIGFDVPGAPTNADANPQLMRMFGLPDARLVQNIGRALPIPGGVEIVEISRSDGERVERAIDEPGTVMLIVSVRDLDATLARLKRLGAPVVTSGGAPVALNNAASSWGLGQGSRRALRRGRADCKPAAGGGGETRTSSASECGTRSRTSSAPSGFIRVRSGFKVRLRCRRTRPTRTFPCGLRAARNSVTRRSPCRRRVWGSSSSSSRSPPTGRTRTTSQDPGSTRSSRASQTSTRRWRRSRRPAARSFDRRQAAHLPAGNSTLKVGIVRDPDDLFLVLIQAPPAPR